MSAPRPSGALRFPPLVDPIVDHGDLARRLCEARQLERDGIPATATIAAILDADRFKEGRP